MVCGQESLATIVKVLVDVLVVTTTESSSDVCIGLVFIEARSEVIWIVFCHSFSKMSIVSVQINKFRNDQFL